MIRIEDKDIDRAVDVLVRSFWNDLFMMHLAPDEARRKEAMLCYFRIILRYIILYGQAYATSSDFEGVALWLPSQYAKMTTGLMLKAGLKDLRSQLDDDFIARLNRVNAFIDAKHEQHISGWHWYLAYIGIDPKFQGAGFASKLIKPMLEKFSAEGLPCYLETNTATNVPLYEHYGFKLLEEFIVPDLGIKFYAMLKGSS